MGQQCSLAVQQVLHDVMSCYFAAIQLAFCLITWPGLALQRRTLISGKMTFSHKSLIRNCLRYAFPSQQRIFPSPLPLLPQAHPIYALFDLNTHVRLIQSRAIPIQSLLPRLPLFPLLILFSPQRKNISLILTRPPFKAVYFSLVSQCVSLCTHKNVRWKSFNITFQSQDNPTPDDRSCVEALSCFFYSVIKSVLLILQVT